MTWGEPVKKDRASNHKRNEVGVLPFPPLPIQLHPLPQPQLTNRAPLIIGILLGCGLIALLIFAVPWSLVSQTLTDSFDSLAAQIKKVQFSQVKQSKKVIAPSEVSTPAISTDATAPAPEILAPETSMVETTPTPEVSTPATLPIEAAPVTPIPEPDPRLLVGRYPVREYTDIQHEVSKGDTLYNLIRVYENRIFPKKYRDWKLLAQYNSIRPPQYELKLGAEFRIPTLAHVMLPKTGYETELKQIELELAQQPNNPDLLNQQAIIHFKRNELNQARSTLRQGIRSSPKNGILRNNLGFIYLIIEDDRRAQSEFELAITHSEKPATPHSNLGVLYMMMNQPNLAIQALESALEADATLLDAKYNLALAHEKIGNVDSAQEHLRELAQLLSDDPEVTSALERLTAP